MVQISNILWGFVEQLLKMLKARIAKAKGNWQKKFDVLSAK